MHNKSDNINLLMDKANESLQAAQTLLESGHHGFSASRSYYAMFYAAEAVLLHKDMQFTKHSAVLSSFNRVFIKQKVFPDWVFRSIQKGFDLRQEGDYGLIPVEPEEARQMIEESSIFIKTMKEFLIDQDYGIES